MRNYIRPLLITAMLLAYSLTAYAAPNAQYLKAYAKHPAVTRALQARADIVAAYNDAISAIQVTAGVRISAVDRQIDSLLAKVHAAVQAERAKRAKAKKRASVPVKGKNMPAKGKQAKADK